MGKRVLVPLDGSRMAEAILPFAEQIARPPDAEIVLVRVEPPASWELLDLLPAFAEDELVARQEEAQQYLTSWVQALQAKGIRASAQVRIGEARSEIVALAQEIGADLIAMTTRGGSGLRRLPVGSVADSVLHTASIPVFLLNMTEEALEATRPIKGTRP